MSTSLVISAGAKEEDGAAADDGFVDVAVAAFAEELAVGEAIGGGFKVVVLELLDFDAFICLFVWFGRRRWWRIGGGDC